MQSQAIAQHLNIVESAIVTRPRDFKSRGFRHPCTGQN